MTDFRAQCGEDKWLARRWAKLGLPDREGFFVDFGAGDGETFSNSYWLEHAKGWRGLLCEPDPRHEIQGRPRSIVERVAVGPPGVVTLALTVDPYLTSSLRTVDEIAGEPRLTVERRIQVASVPLAALLEKHAIERVDLLSIDTEGTEIEAWQTLDLARWRPRIVMAEYSTWHLRDAFSEVCDVWQGDGYKLLHKTTYNCIFGDAA